MCKCVQAKPTHRPRVTLSKEARAALTVRRRDNSHHFKSALQDAWNGLDETVKMISSSHHNSFRHVQNDLCIGRGMMRFKCSKLSAWNAFCWNKRQENKENGMYTLNHTKEVYWLCDDVKVRQARTSCGKLSRITVKSIRTSPKWRSLSFCSSMVNTRRHKPRASEF